MQNFEQGLVITGLGMGLVFLTLVVVMYSIKALDWIFRVKPEAAGAGDEDAAPTMLAAARVAEVGVETVAAPAEADDAASQAAAIAVAIALAQRASVPVMAATAASGAAPYGAVAYGPRPMPIWMKPLPAGADEPQGEVVMLVDIDPGPGTWKAQGRQDGLQ